MRLRIYLLPILLGGGLSSIYFLPQNIDVASSAVDMELPTQSGVWSLHASAPTKMEVETLGADTKFSKADCYAIRPDQYANDGKPLVDFLNLSIVLSGHDLNSSIHRPERCMPAQGHTITSSSGVKIEVANGKNFEAKRLLSVRSVATETRNVTQEWKCITYYFFVGNRNITSDHYGRTFLDMKDRLLSGLDQRWAYVSVSSYYGKVPWLPGQEITLEEADRKLSGFLSMIAKDQINWSQIRN